MASICFVLDDGFADARDALPLFEEYGGRCTLAVVTGALGRDGRLWWGDVLNAHQRGHEIASHTATHANMTQGDSITRAVEWDSSRIAIDEVLGAGACVNFIYPMSARNSISDAEGYLRYRHLFAGVALPYVHPASERVPLVSGRRNWNYGNHAEVLQEIEALENTDARMVLYTHHVDGSDNSNGIEGPQLVEALELCRTLGIEMVTLREAFPDSTLVPFAGFEDSALIGAGRWEYVTSSAGPFSASLVTRTAPNGQTGTRAVRLTSGDTSGHVGLTSPLCHIPRELQASEFTLSSRIDLAKTGGAGGADIRLAEYDALGTLLTTTLATQIQASTSGWAPISLSKTLLPDTRAARVLLRFVNATGEAFYSRVHLAPASEGALG